MRLGSFQHVFVITKIHLMCHRRVNGSFNPLIILLAPKLFWMHTSGTVHTIHCSMFYFNAYPYLFHNIINRKPQVSWPQRALRQTVFDRADAEIRDIKCKNGQTWHPVTYCDTLVCSLADNPYVLHDEHKVTAGHIHAHYPPSHMWNTDVDM